MVRKTWIRCNACGADAFRELSQVDEWHIGQCSQCSLIYVNPMPFFEPTPGFSEMSLDFQYTQYMYQLTPAIRAYEQQQLCRQFEKMADFRSNHRTGRLLEIGCGSGASVRAAVDLGWDAVGLDIDPQLIRLGKNEWDVDLRCMPFLENDFEAASFDFIKLRDVVEHLPNPYDILVEIKRLLSPEGILLIVTPNEDGLPSQLRLRLGAKRNKVATVPPPHHLHGFTPRTLRLILGRAGFDIAQIETTTPVDPRYVTSNNMRSADNRLYTFVWRSAVRWGKGSVLVGWAG